MYMYTAYTLDCAKQYCWMSSPSDPERDMGEGGNGAARGRGASSASSEGGRLGQ